MKEMFYGRERIIEILDEGEIDGRYYYVINLGTHPTAYVQLKEEEIKENLKSKDYNMNIHCGFTYLGDAYWKESDKNTYIGWDYRHAGDWDGSMEAYENSAYNNKLWSVKEILEDVREAINNLNKGHFVKHIYYTFECEGVDE